MKKNYQVLLVNGRLHVVTHDWKNDNRREGADYLGTGAALVGVMNAGETMDDFLTRANRAQKMKIK